MPNNLITYNYSAKRSSSGLGCNRISDQRKPEGVSASTPTVLNILNRSGPGSRYARWLRLDEKNAEQEIELTAEQVAFILSSKTPASRRGTSSPAALAYSYKTRTPSSLGT